MLLSERIRRYLWLLCLYLILAPLNSVAADEHAEFELLSLWTEHIEKHALSTFSDAMRDEGVVWSEQVTNKHFVGIKETLSTRLAHNIPPTGTQWIGGGANAQKLVELGVFKKIEISDEVDQLEKSLKPEIYASVRYDDGLSVLPVGIHLQNFIVYDQRILDEIDETIPNSWKEFIRVAERALAAGYSGLIISDQPWQLRLLIGAILVELLQPDEFRDLAENATLNNRHRVAITQYFAILKKLRPFLNLGFSDLHWADAVERLTQNKSLAIVHGDFIAPLIPDTGDYYCGLPPGNDYVIWAFDAIAFTHTNTAAGERGQKKIVEVVLNPENAMEYITRKGGVSILNSNDMSGLDACRKKSFVAWEDASARVELESKQWSQSLDVIANYSREYLNGSIDQIDPMLSDLFEAIDRLKTFEALD